MQFQAGVSAGQARADVAQVGGRVFGQLHIIPALAVRLTAAQARQLSGARDVHAVTLNAAIKGSLLGPGGGPSPGPGGVSGANLQTTYDQTLNLPSGWR